MHLEGGPAQLAPEEIERRLRLFRVIASTVHYAHQRGVVHRDLKPSNIIVTREAGRRGGDSSGGLPELKILDFGLARITEGDVSATTTLTAAGVVRGTLAYMSPEQARGDAERLDLRTDVYSLGVVLFEMLTGERPTDVGSGSLVEAIRAICEERPKALSRCWRGTRRPDPDLVTIVAKALEKDPEDRYGSAVELAEDVERLLNSQPILARPPSTAYQLRKLVERNRLGATVVAAGVLLLVAFGVAMGLLWQHAERARARAEAGKLLALGRLELEGSPSAALAYATASLEIADEPESRRLALEALLRGPTARVVTTTPAVAPSFSPDGRLLAMAVANFVERRSDLMLFASDGSGEVLAHDSAPNLFTAFGPESRRLYAVRQGASRIDAWAVPGGRALESVAKRGPVALLPRSPAGSIGLLIALGETGPTSVELWDSVTRETQSARVVPELLSRAWFSLGDVDPAGRRVAWTAQGRVLVQAFDAPVEAEPTVVGRHEGSILALFHPSGETVLSVSAEPGEIRFWSASGGSEKPARTLSSGPVSVRPCFDPTGRYLAAGTPDGLARVWDLAAPPDAEPLLLRRSEQQAIFGLAFHPELPWILTTDNGGSALWPLARPFPAVLRGHEGPVTSLGFDPEGRWLVSSAGLEGVTRRWPLAGAERGGIVPGGGARIVEVHPDGERLLQVWDQTAIALLPVEGGEPEILAEVDVWEAAFDAAGVRVAFGGGQFTPGDARATVLDLETGARTVLDAGDGEMVADLVFLPGDRLLTSGAAGVRLWDLEEASFETLLSGETARVVAVPDGATALVLAGQGTAAYKGGRVLVVDLTTGATRHLTEHGGRVTDLALSPDGDFVVTGDLDGVVRIGSATGGDPHLLFGHQGMVQSVAFDPLGRWVASGGVDGTVRLWPVPDGTPLHGLPRGEFLSLLRDLTNYRVVGDPTAPGGYRLEEEPFSGWGRVPSW